MTTAITDFNHFSSLRASADRNDPAALQEVASQFEALFIQQMLKNMRDTSLAEPAFGQSDQHEMYQGMLDQQYALEMSSGRGIGLADMLVRQLGGQIDGSAETHQEYALSPAQSVNANASLPAWEQPEDFVRDVWPHARNAAQKLGVAPEGLLAQAALETGWGQHVMRRPDGESSFNLFGIKAGSSWPGSSVSKPTLEVHSGISRRQFAQFRAYPDIGATFEDYVDLIGTHRRYDNVRNSGADTAAFANALQDSGYATDPKYANKIKAILDSDTMRNALAGLKVSAAPPITPIRTHGEIN